MIAMKYHVLNGVDRTDELADYVRGKKIALLTAASGVNRSGVPTYNVIGSLGGDLRILFSPEHGLYSALQDGKFGDEDGAVHRETGARMYSLGAHGCPALENLVGEVDMAVYDIQDVGARFYTYLCNLTQLMRACRKAKKTLLVLDRPNPIGGDVEGLLLDESRFSSFVGEYAVPTRYGLTVGEYASFVNSEKKIGCDLHVLPCEGWARNMYADETDMLWVNPSPNIPSVSTCFNYIGSCLYEATNISEGRGTTRPFDWIGAPFVDADKLWRSMTQLGLPGVVFRQMCFTPMFNKFAGEVCRGVELHVTDRDAYRPFRTVLYMLRYLKENPATVIRREGMSLRVGQDLLTDRYDPDEILLREEHDCRIFGEIVGKYRIYPTDVSTNKKK
jgi:uncharacterized protein YbbC (DUF1343 family)